MSQRPDSHRDPPPNEGLQDNSFSVFVLGILGMITILGIVVILTVALSLREPAKLGVGRSGFQAETGGR